MILCGNCGLSRKTIANYQEYFLLVTNKQKNNIISDEIRYGSQLDGHLFVATISARSTSMLSKRNRAYQMRDSHQEQISISRCPKQLQSPYVVCAYTRIESASAARINHWRLWSYQYFVERKKTNKQRVVVFDLIETVFVLHTILLVSGCPKTHVSLIRKKNIECGMSTTLNV